MPTISVIIPTFNRQYCLSRTIDSVLQQTLKPSEIIIVDDGSTDNTINFLQQHYPQIKLLQQTHQGVSAARNLGIEQATGEWIALLDSDDAWQPKKLERQIKALQKKPNYRICHTHEIWYRHGKRVNQMDKHQKYGGHIFQQCLDSCRISPSSVIIHKDIFASIGLFDESLPTCEDYDLWLRITAQHPVLYLSEPLAIKYGGHADQLSNHYWGMDRFRIQALQKIIDRDVLSEKNQTAAIKMLQQKINVYLIGAKKRNKTDEIKNYEQILAKYSCAEPT